MPYAALVNGFAAHLLDYDDTFNLATPPCTQRAGVG